MKFFLIGLIILLTSISSKTSLKSKSKLESPGMPISLNSLRNDLFPQKEKIEDLNEYESNPQDFELYSPMTTKQEEQLSPNKLKSNETEGYNLHGFNISNLKNNDMLLVRNFSELQLIPGYNPSLNYEDNEKKPRKYSKDPFPYYNSILNSSDVVKPNFHENLFAVPIHLEGEDEEHPYNFESDRLYQERKRRMRRDPYNTYYDPSYLPFTKKIDNLNRTLLQAVADRLGPKSVNYDEFLKTKRKEKNEIEKILGRKKDIDEYLETKERNYEDIKIEENNIFQHEYKENNKYENKNRKIKHNEPESYNLWRKNTKKHRKL